MGRLAAFHHKNSFPSAPAKAEPDSDPKAYSADREEEPVHPGLQSDTAEDEESENYPQEMFPLEEASHCTENGKPIRTCTEETLEPRLVVYGTRSAWSRGSGNKPSQAQRQVSVLVF
ncbi:unnamed protein product [Porites evermanni]|uniref:Uncharacterized protein n=1 Tax=Porites evermanni TaxID=104178 RepID=A0ABN8STC5_9CNID|nr:unnamed protein product [Porites evermanni]